MIPDVDTLVGLRCAELRKQGIAAEPYLTWEEIDGRVVYRVRVRWPDGSIEDPASWSGKVRESDQYIYKVRTTEDEKFYVLAETLEEAVEKANRWEKVGKCSGFVDEVRGLSYLLVVDGKEKL